MCKSMAEGGQRCSAHTSARLKAAAATVQAVAKTADPVAFIEARTNWEQAAAEHASTEKGAHQFKAQARASEASGDMDTAALLDTILRRGEQIREANRETAAVLKAITLTGGANASGLMPAPPNAGSLHAAVSGTGVSPEARQEVETFMRTVEAMNTLDEHIESVPYGMSSKMTMPELAESLMRVDDVAVDPRSSTEYLHDANRELDLIDDVTMRNPTFRTNPPDPAAAQIWREQGGWALRKVTGPLRMHLLSHPNADTALYEKVLASEPGLAEKVTGLPNCPSRVIATQMLSQRTVHASALERARNERFQQPDLALAVSAGDPDSFHRSEAFVQVQMTPIDSFSDEGRAWLAGNLDKLPTSNEARMQLAKSLALYAKHYAPSREGAALGAALQANQNIEIAGIGDDIRATVLGPAHR